MDGEIPFSESDGVREVREVRVDALSPSMRDAIYDAFGKDFFEPPTFLGRAWCRFWRLFHGG